MSESIGAFQQFKRIADALEKMEARQAKYDRILAVMLRVYKREGHIDKNTLPLIDNIITLLEK